MRLLINLIQRAREHYPNLSILDLLIAGLEELVNQNVT